jgi:hypothetical protein
MPSYNAYDRKAWTEYPSDERGILARRILDDLIGDGYFEVVYSDNIPVYMFRKNFIKAMGWKI